MDKAILEITYRRFFTCEECDIAPSVSILREIDISDDDAARAIADAIAELDTGPFTKLRAMTLEEIEEYRANEGRS